MSISPAVVVKKHGFFSSIVHGLFGTIMVLIVCGSALGIYGLRVADQHVGSLAHQVIASWPDWQRALPPQIADALKDRRAPEYREQVVVSARLAPSSRFRDGRAVVIEVTNNGPAIVSLLALHVVVEEEGVPHKEYTVYAATPVALENSWPGPILPNSPTRRLARHTCRLAGELRVTVEITELRVAGETGTDAEAPPAALPAPPPALPEAVVLTPTPEEADN